MGAVVTERYSPIHSYRKFKVILFAAIFKSSCPSSSFFCDLLNRDFYVTCRTDRTLQAEDFHTADDALSERTISPMPAIEQTSLNQHHTVKPVPLPAEYNLPPAEAHAMVESDILPPPNSSLN